LKCDDCGGAGNPNMVCKVGTPDDCDSPTPGDIDYGVQVTVNGDPSKCALSGFVVYCIDYVSMDANKALSACKTCKDNKIPVTSVAGQSICIDGPLITNCKYYNPDSTCAVCLSGLPFNPNKGTCPMTASELVEGCQFAVMVTTTIARCVSCQVGYTMTSA
jgi:hypothetical protein